MFQQFVQFLPGWAFSTVVANLGHGMVDWLSRDCHGLATDDGLSSTGIGHGNRRA